MVSNVPVNPPYPGISASLALLVHGIGVRVQTAFVRVSIWLCQALSWLCSLPQVTEKPVGRSLVKTRWLLRNALELQCHPAALPHPTESLLQTIKVISENSIEESDSLLSD